MPRPKTTKYLLGTAHEGGYIASDPFGGVSAFGNNLQQPDFDRRYDSRVRHKFSTCSARSILLYSSVINSTLELLRSIPQYSGKTPCYSKVLQILRSTPNTPKYSWST
eukprot:scaffold7076_cov153-Skeletonema_marinoi.AAC.3